jgi:toxin-antitoxin system PIN domain toxin
VRIVDLNILLYAVNSDSPHHRQARAWWERALNEEDAIGLPWVVLLGFLRLSTNDRIFVHPLKVTEALKRIDAWLHRPNVRVPRENDRHWNVLRDLISVSGAAGNLATDAHLAALAISHDATLVSTDADFGRFKSLRWINPLTS